MKNGEKFALLEEGRLSSYEQLNVMGGDSLECYTNGQNTFYTNIDGTVLCPRKYKSCTGILGRDKLVCNISTGYYGAPGPAGFAPGDLHLQDTIIPIGEE